MIDGFRVFSTFAKPVNGRKGDSARLFVELMALLKEARVEARDQSDITPNHE